MFVYAHIKYQHLVTGFLLTLLAALILPVVPIWTGFIYAIGTLSVLAYWKGPATAFRITLILTMLLSLGAMMGAHLLAIISAPIQYVKVNFDQHGILYPLQASALVIANGLMLVVLLGYLKFKATGDRLEKTAVALLIAFAFSYHLPTLFAALAAGAENSELGLSALTEQLSALIKWNSWVIAALLALLFAERQHDLSSQILRIVTAAGFVVAMIVLAQHLAQDHFYVLEARDFKDYEFRVRATYTYHAPTAFLLAIAIVIEACRLRTARIVSAAKLILLCLALSLNETRAISLGLTGAMLALVAYYIYGKAPVYKTIVCLLIAVLFAAQIYHVKINSNLPPAVSDEVATVQNGANDIQNSDAVKLTKYVESNSPRMELLQEGIKTLRGLWIGQGVGTISVPLGGYHNNGEMSAWSSHSLVVDIGLAGGIFSLIIFVLLLMIAALRLLLYLWQNQHQEGILTSAPIALIGCIIFWMIASLFVPQEANYLLPLMFVLAALSVCRATPSPESLNNVATISNLGRAVKYILICGAIGWSIVFSGTCFIPIVELAKLRQEIPDSAKQKIYTNSPKIHWLSHHVIRVFYPPLGNIEMLGQKPNLYEEMWLLWDPSYDHLYGPFIEAQGRNYHRGYGRYPIFNLPAGWGTVNRLQPTLSIIHAGRSLVQVNPGAESPTYEIYYPNFAQWSSFSNHCGTQFTQLNDGHYISFWEMAPREVIYIDTHEARTLDAYTLTVSHQPDLLAYKTLSWRLEGSNDRKAWEILDSQHEITFKVDPIEDYFFHPKQKQYYRYYRLKFSVSKPAKNHEIYISDMKLFSAHKPKGRAF